MGLKLLKNRQISRTRDFFEKSTKSITLNQSLDALNTIIVVDAQKEPSKEVQANKAGTNEEKSLSEIQKYKLGAMFMRMVENPQNFRQFERYMTDRVELNVKLDLP